MGYYTRMLSGMLCDDEGDELVYCKAAPQAWLSPGKGIRVERLQTRSGPTSFSLRAEPGRVTGAIDLPTRYPPSAARLRLRIPGTIAAVRLNGHPVAFDNATGTVALPQGTPHVDVEATVTGQP
jgi:hypothetical protein